MVARDDSTRAAAHGFEVVERPTARTASKSRRIARPHPLRHQHGKKWMLSRCLVRNEARLRRFVHSHDRPRTTRYEHGMELGADDYLHPNRSPPRAFTPPWTRGSKSTDPSREAERKLASLRDNISLMMPHEMRTRAHGILSNAEILARPPPRSNGRITEMGEEFSNPADAPASHRKLFDLRQLELVAADPKNVNACGLEN